jgi:ankyrin repeat protein
LFLEAGMDVNSRDAAGTPMICIAARSGRKSMIEWLLAEGADINAVSKDRGYSAVMDAVWKSSPDIVKFLIEKGANLNFISNDGQTALIVATGASNPRICELLVKNGADPTYKDRMGMSSLDYARLFKKTELAKLYEEYVK